jgi:uncharacterized phage-associated protein
VLGSSQVDVVTAVASVFDVAQHILARLRESGELPVTTWKLQKLVYYSQAWASVWDDEPIFGDRIEAWANGPVCPTLYSAHRGEFKIDGLAMGVPERLRKKHVETIDAVLGHYGKMSPQYLSELTHNERPWQEARRGLKPGERGSNEIPIASMAEYYGGL